MMGVRDQLIRFLRTDGLAKSRSFSLAKWARDKAKNGESAVIVCDFVPVVMWLLRHFHKGMVESRKYAWHSYVYGGDYDEYAKTLLGFVKALKHLGIKPVFFIDGPKGSSRSEMKAKREKWQGMLRKRQELSTYYVRYCKDNPGYRSLDHRHLVEKPLLLNHLLQRLQNSGAEVTVCKGEAERFMAQYTKDHPNTCGILTTNTNLTLLAGCSVLPCELFDQDGALELDQVTMNKEPRDVVCEKIGPDGLAHALCIDVECLPALSILCGNDYTSHYTKRMEAISALGVSSPCDVEWATKWIREHACRTVHQFLSNPEIDQICECFPEYSDAVEQSYNFIEESMESLEDENDPEVEISPLSATLGPQILQGKLTMELLPIINNGIYWRNPLDCEGSDEAYLKLLTVRKWMYSLLCLETVTEYGHSSHSYVKVTMPSSAPELLQMFLSLGAQQRMLTLFAVLSHGQEPLHTLMPQSLYDSVLQSSTLTEPFDLELLLIYACVVAAYRMRIVSDELLAPLVLTCLCSLNGQHAPKIRNKPIPSAPTVTCALQFACLVEHAYNLASLLGFHSKLPLPSCIFKVSLYVPMHMVSMALKDKAPVFNDGLQSFYESAAHSLPDDVMERIHSIIQRGEVGDIGEFGALLKSSRKDKVKSGRRR